MVELRKWVNTILMLVILVVAVLLWLGQRDQNQKAKEYWENPNFKTDSIETYVDYSKIPKPEYKKSVPPVYSINYIDSTTTKNIRVVMNDSLVSVIDSLKGEITEISLMYFKRYPDASKLIYAEFSGDSIRLDLLGIDGALRQNSFGVNYDRFEYQFTDGSLRAQETDGKKTDGRRLSQIYGYAGYNFKLNSLVIGGDYSLYRGKLRFRVEPSISLSNDTQFLFNTNLGYLIK